MFLLGRQLPDGVKVSTALTSFYGISFSLSKRLCARIGLHKTIKVGELSDRQVTQMSAYLSSPGSIPAQQAKPTRLPLIGSRSESDLVPSTTPSSSSSSSRLPPASQRLQPSDDPLRSLLLESDLRRFMQANIAHHRDVGSYKGKRHQLGLPVHGQRTRTNASTAKKLNRIERRAFSTWSMSGTDGTRPAIPSSFDSQRPTVSSLLASLKRPTSF